MRVAVTVRVGERTCTYAAETLAELHTLLHYYQPDFSETPKPTTGYAPAQAEQPGMETLVGTTSIQIDDALKVTDRRSFEQAILDMHALINVFLHHSNAVQTYAKENNFAKYEKGKSFLFRTSALLSSAEGIKDRLAAIELPDIGKEDE